MALGIPAGAEVRMTRGDLASGWVGKGPRVVPPAVPTSLAYAEHAARFGGSPSHVFIYEFLYHELLSPKGVSCHSRQESLTDQQEVKIPGRCQANTACFLSMNTVG